MLSLCPEISHEWGQGFKTNARRDRPRHREVYNVNKHGRQGAGGAGCETRGWHPPRDPGLSQRRESWASPKASAGFVVSLNPGSNASRLLSVHPKQPQIHFSKQYD